MGTRAWVSSLCLCAVLTMPVFAYQTVNEALMSMPFTGEFASDTELGRLSDPFKARHVTERLSYQAMNGLFGPDWFDRYVAPEAIYPLSTMQGPLLARVLPSLPTVAEAVLLGSQATVPLRLETPDGRKWQIELTWEEISPGSWKIVSILVR